MDDGLAAHVGRVLRWVWDPIGLGEQGPGDEYDGCTPGLVALTRDTAVSEDAIVAHLAQIEVEEMRLSLAPAGRTRAARALLGLRDAHSYGSGRLVEQRISPDGLRCLWVFERRDGLYVYEYSALQHEDDENGRWSWWVDAGLGWSGLFDTAEAAEGEARALSGWLRDADIADDRPMAATGKAESG